MNLIGQTLGPYRILDEVARGGQATLYKAEHTVLGRATALKVLHPHLITVADFLEKFEAESKILAKLSHSNIVAIYDAGLDQGQYWIAMEWLAGQTVAELIAQQGKLPVDQAVRIADQVAAALEYAHNQGLIHRDIKPSNMMLLPDNTVKVLDFGIAAIVAAGQKAKTRIGTVEYMSYEQFNGQADHRSDLYSLGASLYEMLTGQLPPRLALHPLTPPRQLNPAIPPRLNQFLQKVLAKKAEDRSQTAMVFRKEMQGSPTVPAQSTAAIHCPHCGTDNRAAAKYCSGCGRALPREVSLVGRPLHVADIGRIASPGEDFEPKFKWSPRGRKLAVVTQPFPGKTVLLRFLLSPLPQNATQIGDYEGLTMYGIPVADQTIPEWSPVSTKLAYISPEDHKIELALFGTPEKLTWGEDADDDMPDGRLLMATYSCIVPN